MGNPKERFLEARKRLNPEGLVFSASASATSPAILPAVGVGTTYIIHELASMTNPSVVKVASIAILGACNTISIKTESKALQKDNYSASPISSTLNVVTDKPLVSSITGHLINFIPLSVLNPINLYAIATRNYTLLAQSEGAGSLALTTYYTTLNTLILKGKTEPFIKGVRKVRDVINRKITALQK